VSRDYSGALCGRCTEWVRDVVLSKWSGYYVCVPCEAELQKLNGD
jgi:hypothetical protein